MKRGGFVILLMMFGLVIAGCVSCHIHYARERFPTLVDR